MAWHYRKGWCRGGTIDLVQDCSRCRKDSRERERWGCERPTKDPQLWIPCLDCATRGCPQCDEKGYEPVYRCPRSVVWPETWVFLDLHEQWPRALPFGGGLLEQPAPYLEAMRLIDAAIGTLREAVQRDEAAIERLVRKGPRGRAN